MKHGKIPEKCKNCDSFRRIGGDRNKYGGYCEVGKMSECNIDI